MIFLQTGAVTAASDIFPWLLEQAPLTVVLGVIIWWLAKKLEKIETERDEISKEVIKLATLWEKKTEQSEDDEDELKRQILHSLEEIKNTLNKIYEEGGNL